MSARYHSTVEWVEGGLGSADRFGERWLPLHTLLSCLRSLRNLPSPAACQFIIPNMITLRPSAEKPRWYGYVFLLAYLMLFVAFVFLADGAWRAYVQYVETTKWLPAEAQVIASSVEFSYGYDGKIYGKKYRARCLLRYEVNGLAYNTEMFAGSIVFVSGRQIELTKPKVTVVMQREWVRLHPPGSFLTVHYDPADPHRISLVGADAGLQKTTPAEQLFIGQGLFLSGMALLLLAMLARKRSESS